MVDSHELTAARRGQIVQRVVLDGWSPAQAAAAFGVGERQVARWVAAFRRRGMASLRDGNDAALAPYRWAWRLRGLVRRLFVTRGHGEPAEILIPQRRGGDSSARHQKSASWRPGWK
jgi:transposase-like protein